MSSLYHAFPYLGTLTLYSVNGSLLDVNDTPGDGDDLPDSFPCTFNLSR